MNFDSVLVPTVFFTLFELIKIFRSITGLGLVTEKLATERFISMYGMTKVNGAYELTKTQIEKFVKYSSMFARKELVIESADGKIFPAVRQPLSDDDIMLRL